MIIGSNTGQMWLHLVNPLAILTIFIGAAFYTWGRNGLVNVANNRHEYKNLIFIYSNFN
jgi:hypothetical protein